jgi:hypothetical protein
VGIRIGAQRVRSHSEDVAKSQGRDPVWVLWEELEMLVVSIVQ